MSRKNKVLAKSSRSSKKAKPVHAKPIIPIKSPRVAKPAIGDNAKTLRNRPSQASPATKETDVPNTVTSNIRLSRVTANISALRKQLKPATRKGLRNNVATHNKELDKILQSLEAGYRELLGVD